MKDLILIKTSLAIAITLALPSLSICQAQEWETVYKAPRSSGHAILADPDPSIPGLFVGGNSEFGSVLHLDQSTLPVTVHVSDPTPGRVLSLNTDVHGNLYAAGLVAQWQVRRSQNGGVTWNVLDDGAGWSSKDSTVALGVAADASGNVYASGHITKKNGQYWIIRRGANDGAAWATVYQASKAVSDGGGVIVVPPAPGKHEGGIFAAGCLTPGSGTQWTVLRSQNAGASWNVVDAWVPGKNQAAAAKVITSDLQGNIFVAGNDGAVTSGWWVRRSGDGGASWETILANYKVTSSAPDVPDGIAADSDGNVYVVGNTHAGTNATWTIRRWDAGSASWDNWPDSLRHPLLGFANVSRSRGVTTDALGNVYVTGGADGQWIVQRLSAN